MVTVDIKYLTIDKLVTVAVKFLTTDTLGCCSFQILNKGHTWLLMSVKSLTTDKPKCMFPLDIYHLS
jgi:hypothetical protein